MAYYRSVGSIPPKRHTQHRTPEGGLYSEELMGEEGFSSDSSLLYHRGIPSAVVDAAPWEPADQSLAENRPLLPRHLRLHDLFPGEEWKRADVVTGRRLVLGNGDVRISYVAAGEASPLYRNAIGDECVYVESGAATVETVFGALPARQGDYVILPRATTHRWLPEGEEPLRGYVIEANSHIAPPPRYLSRYGQLLEHAPYCERDLHGPTEPLLVDGTDVEILVKHRGSRGITGTRYVVPTHPFDVVGGGHLYRRHHPPLPITAARYVIEANSHIAPPPRTCRGTGSSSSTPRTASATCTARPSRSSSTGPTSRSWSSTAAHEASPAPATSCPPIRSTSSAGTATSTPTRSTSPTSSPSPAGCTSRRPCTRCSRARTS